MVSKGHFLGGLGQARRRPEGAIRLIRLIRLIGPIRLIGLIRPIRPTERHDDYETS